MEKDQMWGGKKTNLWFKENMSVITGKQNINFNSDFLYGNKLK